MAKQDPSPKLPVLGRSQRLEVWGDLACFTRPEAKVERLSYPVITPSAARGIFDAIYFKPDAGWFWQVERIEILRTPRFISLRRNEVKNRLDPAPKILGWASGQAVVEPLLADAGMEILETDRKGRTQRQTVALRDVRYRLTARISGPAGLDTRPHEARFERRARLGKCQYQPYLGCREFACYFEPGGDAEPPVALDMDVGLMVYDLFTLPGRGGRSSAASLSLFHASIRGGVLVVPPYDSELVLKGQG